MGTHEVTGRAKGGVATAEAMTEEEKKARARSGALMRWHGDIKLATHGSPEHPLKIGDIELPCYVLEDGTRVLSQRGLQTGIGMSPSGGSKAGEQRLVGFLLSLAEKASATKDLSARIIGIAEKIRDPIRFRGPANTLAFGYEGTILAELCDVILATRKIPGALQHQQAHIADRAELLVRGFARVGIIALIDEATGYQQDRARDALARILEAFIAKELQPWVQTFPSEFYQEMFRLRGLEYRADSVKRPQYFGVLTNDVVYKRLAPGVLAELKRVIPKDESGRHRHRFFQLLTKNTGYPKLREHLGSVVAFMQMSKDWHDFMTKLDRHRPRYEETVELPIEYESEVDDGKGL
jgi:hypothetical protein